MDNGSVIKDREHTDENECNQSISKQIDDCSLISSVEKIATDDGNTPFNLLNEKSNLTSDLVTRVPNRSKKEINFVPQKRVQVVNDLKNKEKKRFKELFSFFNEGHMTSSKMTPNNGNEELVQPKCKCVIDATKIPKWLDDEVFIRKQTTCCPLGSKSHCKNCEKMMFSHLYRGKPIAALDWFTNNDTDYVCSHKFKYSRDRIKKRMFSMLTPHELSLRNIKKIDVYHALIKRFRGFYDSDSKDIIDCILHSHNFNSIRQWCLWKNELDNRFLIEHNNFLNKNLYCSGCGDKCYKFQSRNSNIFYQKCSNNICGFFYKEDSTFARIKDS